MKFGKQLLIILFASLCCIQAAIARIAIVGPDSGEVQEVNGEYYVYTPKTDFKLTLKESTDKPVKVTFAYWNCGDGAERLYLHARAVVKGAPGWPKESLEKVLFAISEGKGLKEKKRTRYPNILKRAELFLQSQGAKFSVERSPTIAVPAPYEREISSCYTSKEIDQILNSVEIAVRSALNAKAQLGNAMQKPARKQAPDEPSQ